tara:strand:+ start:1947 stop:2870 length:924 start_codon:yes stop_codon:yes gene_type:complete
MYVEKKKIHDGEYYYLKESYRVNGSVKTKTVAYLGKGPFSKKELDKIIENRRASEFFNNKQIDDLVKLKKEFANKIKHLDSKLIEDMFRDFKTFYIYNTNTIEGNTLTIEQTDMVVNRGKSPSGKDLREVYDHINAKEVFEWLLEEKPEITHEIIVKVHAGILEKIDQRTGGYRTRGVRVIGAEFLPSPGKYVQTDMEILLKWYRKSKKKLHPLVLSALFHEKFERIHPFYDGNGRTGRMLSNLILLRKEFPPLIIEEKKRKQYYAALDRGHKADLDGAGEEYKAIVEFFFKEMLYTWKKIFSKWGV